MIGSLIEYLAARADAIGLSALLVVLLVGCVAFGSFMEALAASYDVRDSESRSQDGERIA